MLVRETGKSSRWWRYSGRRFKAAQATGCYRTGHGLISEGRYNAAVVGWEDVEVFIE
ncbi:MAG: hypothetical protein IIC01_09820 [Planctomycetes bacterium]|nr:hypothetical protein [Planctomycetota bacterium]